MAFRSSEGDFNESILYLISKYTRNSKLTASEEYDEPVTVRNEPDKLKAWHSPSKHTGSTIDHDTASRLLYCVIFIIHHITAPGLKL